MDVQPNNAPGCRILVVDDEDLVRAGLRRILEREGHKVVVAAGGEEALGLYQSGSFDLVISDLNMPGMKGDELAAAVKAVAPARPVILITALTQQLRENPGRLKHIDFVLEKPFTIESLRETIRRAIAGAASS
jgi:CheY-like chemotaxis protein